eukprot:gene18319-24781_t
MTELLLPSALKADISTAVRQMALLLLGGSVDSYCKKMTELLLPSALKADISTAVKQMALLLLGGSGM